MARSQRASEFWFDQKEREVGLLSFFITKEKDKFFERKRKATEHFLRIILSFLLLQKIFNVQLHKESIQLPDD